MVKIEKLSPGAQVEFVRNGKPQPGIVGTTLTREELDTLQVTGGTVLYSIDEQELVEVSAKESPKSTEQVPEPTPVPAPTIIQPVVPAPAKVEIKQPVIKQPAAKTTKTTK